MADAKKGLVQKLREADIFIGYSPIGDEPDVSDFFTQNGISKNGLSLLPSKDTDPFEVASSLVAHNTGKRVCVFVPGQAFDARGTRHGRGGGWYDRFLAAVPEEWIRTGVASSREMSEEILERKSWDEPVDFIAVRNGVWKIVQTNARVL